MTWNGEIVHTLWGTVFEDKNQVPVHSHALHIISVRHFHSLDSTHFFHHPTPSSSAHTHTRYSALKRACGFVSSHFSTSSFPRCDFSAQCSHRTYAAENDTLTCDDFFSYNILFCLRQWKNEIMSTTHLPLPRLSRNNFLPFDKEIQECAGRVAHSRRITVEIVNASSSCVPLF